MNHHAFKQLLAKAHLLPVLRRAKGALIELRTKYLRARHPAGSYCSCNGARVFLNYSDLNYLWYYGKNESIKHEIEAFKTLFQARRPKVLIDVGAHWGIFPALMALENGTLNLGIERIVCIEPDPGNLPNLEKTVAGIQNLRVDVVPCAISEREQTIHLYRGGGACAQTYKRADSETASEVRAVPLPTIVSELAIPPEDVTHIKLDIDGYEPAFFYGADEFLKQHRPLLLVEFWSNGIKAAGYDLKQYWEHLHSLYRITEVVEPAGGQTPLKLEDLKYLEEKTAEGITNLLLVPK